MKSINDIDFSKCVLPEWQCRKVKAFQINEDTHVSFVGLMGWIAKRNNGMWRLSTDGATIPELDQLRAICAQVDKFIETELARLNAPEWVEVKWTEVERLQVSGARVRYKKRGTDDENFADREPTDYRGICKSGVVEYQVDLHTVPVGVALYEPDWVAISSSDFDRLRGSGATIERATELCGTVECKVDRKTFPPGFELTKPKPKRDAPKCWEAVDFDAFAAKTKTGLELCLDTSLLAVYLCSKETMRHIMLREYDAVWRTDEGAGYVDEAGMADLFAICKRVDEHIEKALKPKPEPVARKTVEMSADEFLKALVAAPRTMRWASFRGTEGRWYEYREATGLHRFATAEGGGGTMVDLVYFFQVGTYLVEIASVDGKDGGTWVPSGPLYLTGVNASGREIKAGEAVVVKPLTDWTVGADGRCNTSEEFVRLTTEVARIIHESAHSLICGQALSVAQLIMAQLAHKQGMRPPAKVETAANEEPTWLPCTREEAEGNPNESETRYGIKSQWFTCDDSLVMKCRLNYYEPGTVKREAPEYRTRAKLDRWVAVPCCDTARLSELGTAFSTVCGNLKTHADRSTLPAGYVLGVGFVEVVK